MEQHDQLIRLLNSKFIQKYKKDYNSIYLGMIQVVAKPFVRISLNTLIVMCSRDNKHFDYKDSIIGAVHGLNDSLVYFQCYLNFTIRLKNVDILDYVVLHVKIHGFKFKE